MPRDFGFYARKRKHTRTQTRLMVSTGRSHGPSFSRHSVILSPRDFYPCTNLQRKTVREKITGCIIPNSKDMENFQKQLQVCAARQGRRLDDIIFGKIVYNVVSKIKKFLFKTRLGNVGVPTLYPRVRILTFRVLADTTPSPPERRLCERRGSRRIPLYETKKKKNS